MRSSDDILGVLIMCIILICTTCIITSVITRSIVINNFEKQAISQGVGSYDKDGKFFFTGNKHDE